MPYRDSKLTFILRESLGGNTKTTLMAACSPHVFNAEETLSTLRFAQRAKLVKSNVVVNRQMSVQEMDAIITQLKSELIQLRAYCTKLEAQLGIASEGGAATSVPSGDSGTYDPLALSKTKLELQELRASSAARISVRLARSTPPL